MFWLKMDIWRFKCLIFLKVCFSRFFIFDINIGDTLLII